jgi:adenylate kinase family enzyme
VERIAVLGPAGAGKTQFATTVARRTGLPVVHLDPLFWRAGWTVAPEAEARAALAAAVAEDAWILEGNFLTFDRVDERFARADTVVYLDLPRRVCFWRVLARIVRDRRRPRPDLPDGCREGLDLPLLRWIWRYPSTDRPRVLALLAGLDGVAVRRLRSRRDVRRFLDAT